MSVIAIPFGWIMKLCYLLVKNYGVALVLFTFITKILLFPLTIKQQKSTAKTAKINPKIQELKKKYGNNQEKYNEELTKLYAENDISMTGGCLPMLVNFILLFAMIEIIYAPLTYVTDVNKDKVEKAGGLVSNLMTVSTEIKAGDDDLNTYSEIKTAKGDVYKFITDEDNSKQFKLTGKLSDGDLKEVVGILDENPGLDEYFADEDKVTPNLRTRPQLLIFRILEDGKGDFLDQEIKDTAADFNYEMFGVFLGDYPSWKSKLVLIPILSLVFQLLVTVISQYFTKKNNPGVQMGGAMNILLYVMPLISFWIAFRFPAGIGIYWIAQSIFILIQTIIVNKIYTPEYIDKLNAKDAAKRKKKGKKSFMERALEAQQMQANGGVMPQKKAVEKDEDGEEKKLSKAEIKELQRKRLNEARKRMAEKYGDDYTED